MAMVCVAAWASDWKDLHERADRILLEEALAAVDQNPQSLDDQYVLALVHLNRYEVDQAQQVFERIARSDPEFIGARWGLAELVRRQHQTQQAREVFEELIKTHPNFAPSYISLGYLLFEVEDFAGSVAVASRLIKRGQDQVDLTNFTRGYLIMAGGKGMIAEEGGVMSKLIQGTHVLPLLRRAERLQPDSVGVLFGLGSFYLMAPSFAGGDKDKGLVYLEKAQAVDPNFPDVYVRLAQAWYMKGDQEKYQEYLAKVRALDPQNALAIRVQKMVDRESARQSGARR
jgi:tetratricopeptide (TPR) repeat protein